jgi:hypothetical protein
MKPTLIHHPRHSQLGRTLLGTMLVLAVLLALCRAQAATTVSGLIAGDTWTKDKSPYVVADDVQVALLTIQPGVEVRVESNKVVEVIGFLTATGSAAEPIVFTRAKTNAGWQGIFFNFTGEGSELAHCRIAGATKSGVRATNAVPLLRSCVFADNSSPTEGGGLLVFNEGYKLPPLLIESCLFTNNTSLANGAGASVRSGTNTVVVSNSSFLDNKANPTSKSADGFGGGLYLNGIARITNSSFNRNSVQGSWRAYGGGAYLQGSGSLHNSAMVANACSSANYTYGGGVFLRGTFILRNCIVAFNSVNSAIMGAAGVYQDGSAGASAAMRNCAIVYNNTQALQLGDGNLSIQNSIFYFNNNNGTQISGTPTVTYSDVQGGFTGTGNINFNPVFANTNDFKLIAGSRCIDAGHPDAAYNDTCLPPSLGTARNDMGAWGGPGACQGIGPAIADTDGDGLPDTWEIENLGNLNSGPDDDPDADKLSNAEELEYGTHPMKKDTDGDGFTDFAEIRGRSDPLDPQSTPAPELTLSVQQVRLETILPNGQTYQIQGSADLIQWLPVETIPGAGDLIERIYNVTNGVQYFRLGKP